ncbi:hypothetical protein BGX38DRAFT_1265022 [Terfezia claveryi]|nr:hypothetical protein BGX38DRAFT_1265022 [Terfezia claveryi]
MHHHSSLWTLKLPQYLKPKLDLKMWEVETESNDQLRLYASPLFSPLLNNNRMTSFKTFTDERLVGSQQPEHLQTRGQHHEIAIAVHIKNIYSNLGGTTIATLCPSIEAFSPLPLSSSSSLSQKYPLTGIGPRFRESTNTKGNPGKLDKRNPPLKTRLPGTGHPATVTTPQISQPPQVSPPPLPADYDDHESDTDDEEPSEEMLLYMAVWNSMAELRTAVRKSRDRDEFDFLFRIFCRQYQRVHNMDTTGSLEAVEEAPPPPPPPTPVIDTSTQTTPPTPVQKPTTNSVSTNTDPPPTRTYAEAATTTTSPSPRQPPKDKGKAPSKATPPPTTIPPRTNREKIAPPPESQKGKAPPETRGKGKGRLSPPPTLAKTMVLHAAPTKFKPGQMRRWIEEDNKSTGVQILGIRWLMQEHRRAGKMASSLVIYMKERINIDQGLRMGRRFFRTTVYDWSR